jgi:peroxiredoxin
MVLTESKMLTLNTKMPDFVLPDCGGAPFTRDLLVRENGLLVMFICNHCPYVQHYAPALANLGHTCDLMGIGVAAINANDIRAFPEDAPHKMQAFRERHQFSFPYLFDDAQQTAREFRAACTPDFFLYNQYQRLVYRGRFDASTPGLGEPVTGEELYMAMQTLMSTTRPFSPQYPSVGSSIKWRKAMAS